MALTVLQMLDAIDAALREAPRGRHRIVLKLRNTELLIRYPVEEVLHGRWLGGDADGNVFGYTRRQVEKYRESIRIAALDTAGIDPEDHP